MQRHIALAMIPMLCMSGLPQHANAQKATAPNSSEQKQSVVPAQTAKGTVFGRWELLCGNKNSLDPAERCRISQTVLADKSRVRLLMIRVYKGTPNIAMISTPHSISLKPGIVLKIDEKESRAYSFETCNEDGCHVGIPLTDELEAEFRSGSNVVFHFFDGGQRRVAAPVALEGFKDASNVLAEK